MRGLNYNIGQLFELAFGMKLPMFVPPPAQEQPSGPLGFTGVTVRPSEEITRLSWMGTPIVFPFTFEGKNYNQYNQVGQLVSVPLADFEMPAATLVDFSRAKIMPKTAMSSGTGSVKEIYAFDDWKIRIRGICITDHSRLTAKTAQEQKEQLLEFEKVAGSVKVSGAQFHEKDIYELALSSIDFRQLEGKPDMIPFEFSAESDQPFELIL